MIIFCFSKNRCDKSADNLSGTDLTSSSEKSEIRIFCDKAFSRLKGSDRTLPQVRYCFPSKELCSPCIGFKSVNVMGRLSEFKAFYEEGSVFIMLDCSPLLRKLLKCFFAVV